MSGEAGKLLMDLSEVSKALGCDYETVRGFIHSGQLKAVRLAGRRKIQVRPADLESFITESKLAPKVAPVAPGKRQEMPRKRRGQKSAVSNGDAWWRRYA